MHIIILSLLFLGITLANSAPLHAAELPIQLSASKSDASATFALTISGPTGTYSILASQDLRQWSPIAAANNTTGSVTFIDAQSQTPAAFYKAALIGAHAICNPQNGQIVEHRCTESPLHT
jgi:hypothetical protein